MPYGGSVEKEKHNCLSTEKSKSEKDKLTAVGGESDTKKGKEKREEREMGRKYRCRVSHWHNTLS